MKNLYHIDVWVVIIYIIINIRLQKKQTHMETLFGFVLIIVGEHGEIFIYLKNKKINDVFYLIFGKIEDER